MHVLLSDPLPPAAMGVLPPDAAVTLPDSPAAFEAALADSEALCCLLTRRVDESLLARAPKLRVVANVAAGLDNIDLPAATRRKIIVTHTPGVLTDATADLTFALLLSVARKLAAGERLVRAGEFRGWRLDLLLGTELAGKTLGIVGLGRIGQAVARRAAGFGIRIVYAAPRRASPSIERLLGAEHVGRPELLRQSDFVSVHCPLTRETKHLIGKAELEAMKKSALLINTSRGAIVDEAALADALGSGEIAGAGLDVFENEPTVDPRLLALENVVLLPHIGSATHETRDRMAATALRSIVVALSGGRPAHVANVELFPRKSYSVAAESPDP